MVYSKRIEIFAVKQTFLMTRKLVGSQLPFHFLQVTHFSLSNSCFTDQTAQREKKNHKIQWFLSMLAPMAGCWV